MTATVESEVPLVLDGIIDVTRKEVGDGGSLLAIPNMGDNDDDILNRNG